jgi:hypothetical protein
MDPVSGYGAPAGHLPSLADRLDDVATMARSAATFAEGEYIPQMSRREELERSWNDAGFAAAAIEQLAPEIATLDGGDDGLHLAKRALEQIRDGRQALHEGVAIHGEDDLLRGGTIVIDDRATHTAGQQFSGAANALQGIADIARIESTSGDELLRGLVSGG